MSDYISRDELFDNIRNDVAPFNVAIVFRHIHNMPAVDAVPVVFCKDCIHSISYVDKSGATAYVVCNLDEDSDEIELRTPMDYCSYGDREEADT